MSEFWGRLKLVAWGTASGMGLGALTLSGTVSLNWSAQTIVLVYMSTMGTLWLVGEVINQVQKDQNARS